MTADPAPAPMIEVALEYAAAGFPVLPLHTPILPPAGSGKPALCTCSRACDSIGKHPRIANGSTGATTDPEQIRKWWSQYPAANVGIATGRELPGGGTLAVLDVDGPEGLDSFLALEAQFGEALSRHTVRTGSGGLHIYLRVPDSYQVRNSQARKQGWNKIDVRGTGGYVVAPPSLHASGARYEWIDQQITTLEGAWLEALTSKHSAEREPSTPTFGQRVTEGSRNEVLASYAGSMRDRGMDEDAIAAALQVQNVKRCDPPLGEDEVAKIAASISRYEPTSDPVSELTTLDAARSLLTTLDSALKTDPGAAFKPDMLAALCAVEEMDSAAAARAVATMKKNRVPMRMYQAALKKFRAEQREAAGLETVANLGDVPLELVMPEGWRVRQEGVFNVGGEDGPVRVLPVPLYLTRRLRTVAEQEEKVELQYQRDNNWHRLVVDRSIAGSASAIIALADRGLPVNSDNALQVVRFLHALEGANLDRVPLEEVTTQAGWIGSSRFYPGAEAGVDFEPDHASAVTQLAFATAGDHAAWVAGVVPLMREHPLLRLSVAASLAAPLLKPAGHRSFVVHLWGDSGGGKTAALSTAMSVWGAPNALMGNFNTTAVGLEYRMALMNGLPVGLNERQAANRKVDDMVYMAGEGQGRTRGAKAGGIRRMSEWQMILLTNGEEPLVSETAPEGARTRTIEYEGRPVDDEQAARDLYELVAENHGWAGREFVRRLIEMLATSPRVVRSMHDIVREKITQEAPGRIVSHVSALALIGVADQLADKWLYGGALGDTSRWVSSLAAEMTVKDDSGEAAREYNFICDLVDANRGRFRRGFGPSHGDLYEVWGVIDEGVAYFNPGILKRELEAAGLRYIPAKKRLLKSGFLSGVDHHKSPHLSVQRNKKRYVPVNLPEHLVIDIPAVTYNDSRWGVE